MAARPLKIFGGDSDQRAKLSCNKNLEQTLTLNTGGIKFIKGDYCLKPFKLFQNGGLSFLLMYFCMLVLLGGPVLLLEIFLGQYSGTG